jgi:hypothetical protein
VRAVKQCKRGHTLMPNSRYNIHRRFWFADDDECCVVTTDCRRSIGGWPCCSSLPPSASPRPPPRRSSLLRRSRQSRTSGAAAARCSRGSCRLLACEHRFYIPRRGNWQRTGSGTGERFLADDESLNIRVPRGRARDLRDRHEVIYKPRPDEGEESTDARGAAGEVLYDMFVGLVLQQCIIYVGLRL